MRKLYKLFVAAALLFASTAAWAQEDELIVANGTTTNSYIPVYGLWIDAAQHNQVLYPADSLEDMVGGTISGITFYLSSQNSNAWGTTVTLKLGTTDASTLSGLNTSTSLTQVWQGPWNGQAAEISVTFDEEFVYEGDNLLLDIQTTAATYSSASFYGVSLTGASHYTYSSSGSTQNFLPKTKFEYTPGSGDICRKPKFMTFSDYTNNGATISWTEPVDGGTLYVIFIDGVEVGTTTDTFYTASGLSANEDHYVVVKNVCSEGDSSGSLNGVFHTLCQEGNCQVQVIPGAQYTSSTYMPHAKFYQNGSLLADVSSTTSVDICNGDSLIIIYQAPGYSYSPTLQIIDAGGTDLFNGSTSGYNTGDTLLAVANGCPSCIPPVSIQQTPTDAFSTTIHWTDNNVAGLGDYVVIVNGVEYPVSGDSTYALATWPLNHYDVSVARICDGNDTSAFRNISFNAPCDESVYAEVPFFSGFEELNNNESPDCWVQVQTGGNASLGSVFPSAYRWAPNAHTGSVYFEFESANGNETEVLALPRMEDVSTLQLSFYASTTTSTYKFTLEAGVIELDDEDNMVFVPVDTIQLQAGSGFSESYHVYNVLFDTYEGNGERLALRTTPNPPTNTSIYTLMLDDFNVIRVGVPVLGPFEHSVYSLNMGDTLHLSANLMTGEVETWEWTSDMIENGEAVIVSQDSNTVDILYLAAGTDILTVTASNSIGSASKSVTVNVIDNSLISEYPYSTGFEPGEDRSWYTDGDLNGWYIGTAVSYDESGNSLYISRDNGATNQMADGLTCRSYAYRHFDMGTGGEYQVDFMWKGNGTSGSRYMEVYLAQGEVNPTHGSSPSSSWTRITTCNNASTWTAFSDVVEAEAGVNTLIFYWYGTGNVNPPHAVDNITINKLNCSRVGHLTASNVLAHSAEISWSPRNDESSWYIQVDSAEGYNVTDTMVTLTGFAGESHHTVVVRALCDEGDTSYASTVSFTTTISCPAVTNIHTTDVTGTTATIAWHIGGEETAWKVCVDGGDTVEVADTTYTINGLLPVTSHTIMVMADCGDEDGQSVGTNYTFNTLCDEGTCDLLFFLTDSYSGMDGWNGGAIRVVQNGIQVGSATILSGSNAADVSVPVCSSMPVALVFTAGSYPGEMGGRVETLDGTVVYTISGMTSSMNNDTLATVESPCPTCMPATNLVVDTITATECILRWSAMGSNTNWAVYLDSVQVGGTMTDTTYSFTGLEANTTYLLGVRALCEDNDSSAIRWVTIHTACAGGNCEFTLLMTDSFGDGWNGNAIEVYQYGELFGSYTVPSSSSSNTVTVSPCLGDPIVLLWHSGSYSYEASFVVKDAADSVLLTSGSMSGFSTGDSLMTFDGMCNATVIMSPGTDPGTDCAAPTGLTVTATDSTVTVSFTGVSGYIEGYEAEIQEGSAWAGGMGEEEEVTGTTHTFTGLTPGTDYVIGVRTVCDSWDYEYSSWVTITVTTTSSEPMECYAPTGLTAINVDSNRATITWTPGGEEEQWQIKVNSDTNYILASSSTYTLNNLTPSTTYHIRVRSYCGADNQSGWSAELTFTTTASGNDGIEVADGMQASLYPNPATSKLTVEAAEMVEVSIIDLNGREVYRSDIAATEHRIDVSGLAKGAYFVRLTGNNNTAVRKLIVK